MSGENIHRNIRIIAYHSSYDVRLLLPTSTMLQPSRYTDDDIPVFCVNEFFRVFQDRKRTPGQNESPIYLLLIPDAIDIGLLSRWV